MIPQRDAAISSGVRSSTLLKSCRLSSSHKSMVKNRPSSKNGSHSKAAFFHSTLMRRKKNGTAVRYERSLRS